MGWVAGDNEGRIRGGKKVKKFTYSFAVNGGATGDIALTAGDSTIPSGSLVVDAWADVQTVFTSGGAATVAVKLAAAADLNTADAISGAPWSTTGLKRLDKLIAADAGIKLAAAAAPVLTVATATLTAGIAVIYVEFIEPDAGPLA